MGLNDFDEATPLPWTQDLVRLAASAYLAADGDLLGLPRRAAAEAILEGYRSGIQAGGPAFVLEEEHGWLRQMAMTELRDPVSFWQKLDALPPARAVGRGASAAIEAAMPAAGLQLRWARRVAGMGSLGRPRVVGLADWQGGRVAREAKALAPSAWLWATDQADDRTIRCDEIVRGAIRVPDPTVRAVGPWLIRRLAPHCSRIELADLPTRRDEARLLHAMGFETANVHGGTRNAARTIRKELDRLESRWLHDAAKRFAAEVIRDWRSWRRASRPRRS